MNRLILVAVCVGVALSSATAAAQYVVSGPMPVAVYRPIPAVVPVAPVFQPVVPAVVPVVTYRPAVVPAPLVYGPPVPYGTTVAYGPGAVFGTPSIGYAWPTVVVQPRFYVPGQPVRNVLRAVAP